MRREVDEHGLVTFGGEGEALFDLGRVSVCAHAVGVHTVRHLTEESRLLWSASGARGARLGVDDDLLAGDGAGLEERDQ